MDDSTELWEAPDAAFDTCEEPPPTSAKWYDSETGTKLHFRAWAEWDAPADIVEMARVGVRWMAEPDKFPERGVWDNYATTQEERWHHIINKQFDDFHFNGIIEYFEDWLLRFPSGVIDDFVLVVNSVGIVPKSDDPGEGRPIFDCSRSGVNSVMLALPFSLPRPTDFLARLRPGYVIHKKDVRHGFYTLTLVDSGPGEDGPRRWVGFRHPITGRLGRFCAPAMGAKQAPYFFCRVTAESIRIFREHARLLSAWLRYNTTLPDHAPCPAALHALIDAGHSKSALADDLDAAFVDCYVDDYIQVGPPLGVTILNGVLEETGKRLGLEYKTSKDVCGTEVEVLGALIAAPENGGPELAATLRVSGAKAARYCEAVRPVLDAARRGEGILGGEYDRVVGKLAYVACLSRFGRAEMRCLYVAPGAVGTGTRRERRNRLVTPNDALVHCLEKWMLALSAPVPYGVTGRTRWSVMEEAEALLFPFLLQRQDASGWGWGGRAGARGVIDHLLSLEVVRSWTSEERRDLSITLRELLAAVELFEHAAPHRANSLVLIESDNTGAVSIINNGGSSVPAANTMVRRIAATCSRYNIEVRARHVPGTEMIEDGIDGLSRPGKGTPPSDPANRAIWEAGKKHPDTADVLSEGLALERTEEDYKFLHFLMFDKHHAHTIDACCDARGFNAQVNAAGVRLAHPFHADRPVQLHWRDLVGKTTWCNPPFSYAEDVIEALVKAYLADPFHTRATVLLPVWETTRWHRRYVTSGVLQLVHTFEKGARLFNQPAHRTSGARYRRNSGGTLWKVAVYRLGCWSGDPLLPAPSNPPR